MQPDIQKASQVIENRFLKLPTWSQHLHPGSIWRFLGRYVGLSWHQVGHLGASWGSSWRSWAPSWPQDAPQRIPWDPSRGAEIAQDCCRTASTQPKSIQDMFVCFLFLIGFILFKIGVYQLKMQ